VLSRAGRLFTPIDTWDVYVLTFPQNTELADPLNAILKLPRCIYAEPNEAGMPTTCAHEPDDSLASNSWHLYRIGMPCAWDQALGDTTIHIGVIDGGVDYHVLDLGAGIGPGYKVAGGYDYAMDDSDPRIEWGDDCPDPHSSPNHGDQVQSVLGALTNNDSVGVAGVAGGWGGYDGEIGPSIYHFKIRYDDCGAHDEAALANAIKYAHSDYGCQILSHSNGWSYNNTVKEQVRDFHKSGGLIVASFENVDTAVTSYLASYRNDWILCCQGSSRHPTGPSDQIPEQRISSDDPLYDWGAAWPRPYWPIPALATDVSAPASHMCILFADSLSGQIPYWSCSGSGVSYTPPQIAGIAALVLAKNDTLSVYDIEGILSASCTDILTDYEDPDTLRGWDRYSGWGRVNADSCLMFADPDHPCQFTIQHFKETGGGAIVDSSDGLEPTRFGDNGPIDPGWYYAKRYEVRRAVTPPSGYKFLWGTPCEGAGWGWTGGTPVVDRYNFQEPYCDLYPSTQYASTCTLFTYIYEVWEYGYPPTIRKGIFPAPADSLDWAYAAIYQGVSASVPSSQGGPSPARLRIVSAVPTPSNSRVLVSFEMPATGRVSMKIYDVRGREVASVFDKKMEAGAHEVGWNGRNNAGDLVAPGVYMCRVATENQHDVKKMILMQEGSR